MALFFKMRVSLYCLSIGSKQSDIGFNLPVLCDSYGVAIRGNTVRAFNEFICFTLRRGQLRRDIKRWFNLISGLGLSSYTIFSNYPNLRFPSSGIALMYYKVPKRVYKFSGGKWRYSATIMFIGSSKVRVMLWKLSLMFMSLDFSDEGVISRGDRAFWFIGEIFGGTVGEVFFHEDYQRSLLSTLIDVGYDVKRLTANSESPVV